MCYNFLFTFRIDIFPHIESTCPPVFLCHALCICMERFTSDWARNPCCCELIAALCLTLAIQMTWLQPKKEKDSSNCCRLIEACQVSAEDLGFLVATLSPSLRHIPTASTHLPKINCTALTPSSPRSALQNTQPARFNSRPHGGLSCRVSQRCSKWESQCVSLRLKIFSMESKRTFEVKDYLLHFILSSSKQNKQQVHYCCSYEWNAKIKNNQTPLHTSEQKKIQN